jgi:hypothetical protein
MRTTARQTRENRTITVDFQNEAPYAQLLGDGKTCFRGGRFSGRASLVDFQSVNHSSGDR